ncbi:MAG: phosphatidate cytidylyltransferase [Pseudomonadota bacterium]
MNKILEPRRKENAAPPTSKKDRQLSNRAVSGAALGLLSLAGIYVGGLWFSVLVFLMSFAMVFEWAQMVLGRPYSPAFFALAAGALLGHILVFVGYPGPALGLCFVASAIAAINSPRAKAWILGGGIYILAPTIGLISLRNGYFPAVGENARALTFGLFLVVWASDTGAFLVGSTVGGPRISPTLSPEKTWSGVIAGSIMGMACGAFMQVVFFREASILLAIAVGGALGAASLCGDLIESACKRAFGVKDTSNIIPGHGGVLDRLDGMILATAAMTGALFVHTVFAG